VTDWVGRYACIQDQDEGCNPLSQLPMPLGWHAGFEDTATMHPLLKALRRQQRRQNPSAGENDVKDFQRLHDGEQVAWEQFVVAWSSRLYPYLAALLHHPDAVQEVLCATLLALVQTIRCLETPVPLVPLVYAAAYRQVMECRHHPGRPQPADQLRSASANSFNDAFSAALTALPLQVQQILLLRYQAGLSVRELAQVLGCSYQTTEALLSQARHQFETELWRRRGA
jgi:RNA polymerase sigma factor (sigma-70 family)